MRRLRPYLLAFFLLFAPIAVRADIFGSVRGIVHDPQHKPVANAQLTLKSKTSDWSQQTQSNVDGEFTFSTVPIGDYLVTVNQPGFDPVEQPVTVVSDSSPILHFMLEISTPKQTVTVHAMADMENADSATPTTLVNRQDIETTPGADRTNSLGMITDFVPGAYLTHDMLHIRGGHQVSWLIDGVSIPNTNIATNLGPQIDPKDIDYLEVQRGSYEADTGDRTYGAFNVMPRTGFERNNEADLTSSFGNFYQTNDELNFGGHSKRFAYFGSLSGNRSNLGLETPISEVFHDAENGIGGFGSLIFNANPKDQFRFVASLRRDYYKIPYDPDPNDSESSEFDTSGLRDYQQEADAFTIFSWVHTFNPDAVLTVSPFYHYNSANYRSSPNDTPIATTDLRSSNYGGGQASMAFALARNNFQAGAYTFAQRDNQTFGLIFNDGSGNVPVHDVEPVNGALEALFLEDKISVASWLTLTAGVRYTHFSANLTENATDPRVGAALRVPHLKWILHAYYGRFYQAPPLASIAGPLLEFAQSQNVSFVPLRGERDEEHQFGITIPIRGWSLDFDTFETRASNFFDHNNIGESELFSPVTIAAARIRGNELTIRSPRFWNRADVHLAYSNQMAQGEGAITGGLICYNPEDPAACAVSAGYSALDHDQRNTLNVGFDAKLPWQSYGSSNVYYGSGFSNGSPDAQFPGPYLPGHAQIDIALGKDFGERFSVAVNALNIANRHLLIDNSLTFGGFHYDDPREVYVQIRYRFHY